MPQPNTLRLKRYYRYLPYHYVRPRLNALGANVI